MPEFFQSFFGLSKVGPKNSILHGLSFETHDHLIKRFSALSNELAVCCAFVCYYRAIPLVSLGQYGKTSV